MNKSLYSFDEFNSSSLLIRSLLNESEKVAPFIEQFFSEEHLLERGKNKVFSDSKRTSLVQVLKTQNSDIKLSDISANNINKLNDKKTVCITTGHQLNMATGPLYTLYKIIEVINWCEKLNEKQAENHFVPIFWMATEDHDFEEINHVNLFGSKIEWQHKSVDNSVVGRIEMNEVDEFIDHITDKFRDLDLKEVVSEFLKVYKTNATLASANRQMVNQLFGKYGLVIIDGDDKILKQSFKEIAKAEIEKNMTFSNVSDTNTELEGLEFHQQVYVRESNLFYIEPNGERVRIEKNGLEFLIKQQTYNVNQLQELLEKYPHRFSPNALLRPAYQESILPNIAYVGGGGEIAYWLQLKSTFKYLNIDFPLLKVRESVLLIDDRMTELMEKTGYSILDLKDNIDAILKDYVTKNQTVELSLQQQKKSLGDIKTTVLEKALAIDKNATAFIEAEFQRMENQLDKMEKKFIASEKKNQEKAIKQIEGLQNKLYPDGGFQERYYNYLGYIQVPDFIELLKTELKQRMTAKAAIQILNI